MSSQILELPIVLEQCRIKLAPVVFCGILSLVFGLSIQPNYWMVDGLIPAERLLVPIGVGLIVLGVYVLLQPARLVLSAAGIEYRLLLSERKAPWSAVQAVGHWTYRRRPGGVRVKLRTGQALRLAGGWPLETQALAELIEQTRRQFVR
jgi:hypothetical protein